jgi:radical SAM superfamily enzyme YgiQ (UPF0313 family)
MPDTESSLTTPANVLLVFPRFDPRSFWNLHELCEIRGVRCASPPLGLITVAALLPPHWRTRLVDRNAEELTDADLAWADLVMTGGMLKQQHDTLALIDLCRARGKPVVIGGPDATSQPDIYRGADFLVIGEAEGIIDEFIAAWSSGATSGVFEAAKFQVDVTKSPVPRFDLLTHTHYVNIGVQFSRGCPFNCEFCDIIELYGRVPRAKTNAQMLTELDALYEVGYRGHVDFVDDNLIGNKKALKRFLPELAAWQRSRGVPFRFSTEASINLADDPDLLRMLRQANFFVIFVGIESPDTDTLILTQKKQNTRRSLADSIHKIYAAGIVVIGGFIVGFDSEKASVADAMIDCIGATSVPVCMVGLLTALPNTQLTRRLEREGRLLPLADNAGDQCTAGLNFVTLRRRRDVLADYRAVLQSVFHPDAYFARVKALSRALDCSGHPTAFSFAEVLEAIRMMGRLAWHIHGRHPALRRHFWRTFIDCGRNNFAALERVMTMVAFYLHLGPFARSVIADLDAEIAMLDREDVLTPRKVAAPIAV